MLIFSHAWFDWATTLDRMHSFHKVGITTEGVRPDLVIKPHFHKAPTVEEKENDAPLALEPPPSPPGLRKGSNAYYKVDPNPNKIRTLIAI